MTTPAQQLADVFVALSGGVTGNASSIPDIMSTLVTRSPGLFGTAGAVAVTTVDEGAAPQVYGSEESTLAVERAAVEWREGPGHVSRRTGRAVPGFLCQDRAARERWPRYTRRALKLGYSHAAAFPLRGPERPVGSLVLLGKEDTPLAEEVGVLAQSLADFTALALVRHQELRASRKLSSQLEHALVSRVVIEQAKGIVATHRSIGMPAAFDVLRGYARSHRRALAEVAHDVVEGRLDLSDTAG